MSFNHFLCSLLAAYASGASGTCERPGATFDLLEVSGFDSKLTGFLDHIVGEGFVREAHRDMLQLSEPPQILFDALDAWRPTMLPKWTGQKPS